MASYSTSWTVPATVMHVLAAAAYASQMAEMDFLGQTPMSVKCKSRMSFGLLKSSYPVTIDITTAEQAGATTVIVYATCFGMGPLQTRNCRDKATKLLGFMSNILQNWAQQAAQPAPPAGPAS
jgi:hypothetical protein